MTNEEAIKVLLDEWKCIDRNDGINCDRKCESCDLVMDSFVLKDAYNMAIKALEQEPTDENLHREREQAYMQGYEDASKRFRQEPSGDLISRQDAIKAIEEKAKRIKNADTVYGLAGAVGILFDLPSVNPQPCEDAISRQAVLETLDDMDNVLDEDRTIENYKELLKECYEVLPPVRPQEPCKDAISRQATLDIDFNRIIHTTAKPAEMIRQKIEQLPSVKPQICEDAISRQAVHEAITRWAGSMSVLIALPTREVRPLLESIHKLPSVKPQENTGHWIGIDEEPHEVWECDHCGFVIDGSGCIDPYDYRDTYKYCPYCGAKMVEPQESEEE